MEKTLLDGLRSAGIQISVSSIALGELWARSIADDQKSTLCKAAARISSYLDPLEPVSAGNGLIVHRLGGRFNDGRPDVDPSVAMSAFRDCWQQLASGTISDEEWRSVGERYRVDNESGAETYLSMVSLGGKLGTNTLTGADELQAIGRVAATMGESWARRISVQRGFQERFHGYLRVTALRALKLSRKRRGYTFPVDPNDVEDERLMNHVAESGVVVACRDHKFLAHVDESGTFQAPWIRTIGEILTDGLPLADAWGKQARREASRFRRRAAGELAALESRLAGSSPTERRS